MARWRSAIQPAIPMMDDPALATSGPVAPGQKPQQRIATLLFAVMAGITILVLIGLVAMTVRLAEIHDDLARLRDNSLPRLIKLSQLSRESSATVSIAPALSTNPSRFEFETLLSRIKDKEGSQEILIRELSDLINELDAAKQLQRNNDLLTQNLQALTNVVRQQIGVRTRLERHIESLSRTARTLAKNTGQSAELDALVRFTAANIYQIMNTLLDPKRARFSRNKRQISASISALDIEVERISGSKDAVVTETMTTVSAFQQYWHEKQEQIYADKRDQLTNDFKIKALVEENSLVASRLLSSAGGEFWRAGDELTSRIAVVVGTTRFNLAAMAIVLIAFVLGTFTFWLILQRRVFRRLNRMRDALRTFAQGRDRAQPDPRPDEIGEISTALNEYMDVIEQREEALAEKNEAMAELSDKLSKYLSPQVYDSIFSGRQDVTVASSRKKLTVFFSDIANFTETADRLESEELTQLLNHYLTEMSQIALQFGATIDKYVGDAILIFFGDPETKGPTEDALQCVRMAIAMRDRLRDLDEVWRQSGIEKPLVCRMGIHTGFCTVGNFGSEDRMDYTIIGGAVNTAARLEEQAEPGEILISYETFAHVRDVIHCQEHGTIEVKGIAYPVATFLAVDLYDEYDRRQQRIKEDHATLKLELDVSAMTAEERTEAGKILRRALDQLS